MKRFSETLKNLKFSIRTFGCQMNENDSERIAGILKSHGAQPSKSLDKSDLIIVNTCAVREKSEEKLYSFLGRLELIKKGKPIKIGVVGCVAQLHSSQLIEKKPVIDFVIGPDNYAQLPCILADHFKEKTVSTSWSKEWHEIPHPMILRESPVSAYVTIMEGCNNCCSYCIVPFTRGREKYRPMVNIRKEIMSLADEGYKEIQLLGQNVNTYKDPQTGRGFSELLREVDRIDGIEWIRFITSHPKNFTSDIAIVMQETEKVCHQLHLPVQSGSTSVLKEMNREYTREQYLELIAMLRGLMPDISLSTDIIVGFPGETENDYQDTLSLLESIRFSNIFSFRYSPRPLTGASKKKDTVSFEEKRRRLIELQKFQKKLQIEHNKFFIGTVIRALCHGKSKKDSNIYSGRNEGYQVVNFRSKENVIGQFVDVRIVSSGPYSLRGEAIL